MVDMMAFPVHVGASHLAADRFLGMNSADGAAALVGGEPALLVGPPAV